MSIGSDIRDKLVRLEDFSREPQASFSSDVIRYFLSTADAFIILLSSIALGAATVFWLRLNDPRHLHE